jgi:hypothetical protein
MESKNKEVMKTMERANASTAAVTPEFLSRISRGIIEIQQTPKKLWFPVGMMLGLLMFSGLLYGAYNFLFLGHHTLANTILSVLFWGLNSLT